MKLEIKIVLDGTEGKKNMKKIMSMTLGEIMISQNASVKKPIKGNEFIADWIDKLINTGYFNEKVRTEELYKFYKAECQWNRVKSVDNKTFGRLIKITNPEISRTRLRVNGVRKYFYIKVGNNG